MSSSSQSLFKNTFGSVPQRMAFAPGRIEFIGNHTDYNGGLVMGAAVTEGITVSVGRRKDRKIALISETASPVEVALETLRPLKGPSGWANYPLGVVSVLRDAGMVIETGFNLAVTSTLPAGAGMSSSAAFELATAYSVAALFSYTADRADFARLARRAENDFVGVPCGILDQGVSAFGRKNHLVRIDCAREEFSVIPMPAKTHFWIFNSNKKHSLVDSHYADRHKECHEARDILAKTYPGIQTLSDLNAAQVEACAAELGECLLRRALHVVTENARVRGVESALAAGDLTRVGTALLASHESSRVNFENSIPELDRLVELLKAQPSVYGARLTGGGFGGAVMALTSPEFSLDQASSVKAGFVDAFGSEPCIIHTRAGEGAGLLNTDL